MTKDNIKGIEFSEDGKTLVHFPSDYQGAYAIPEGVTKIQSFAFMDCISLTEVWIPDSVTSIGIAAFDSCTSLTHVRLPAGPVKIDETAFLDCPVKMEDQVKRESMRALITIVIAKVYTNNGYYFLEQGELERAANYFVRALELKERYLGDIHPETRTLLQLLAEIRQ